MDGSASLGIRKQVFTSGSATDVTVGHDDLDVSVTGPQFEKMVRDVQHYIAEGDVIQVNLSVRQSKTLNRSPACDVRSASFI